MPTHSSLLLLVTLWASVQDGLGLPVVKQAEPEAIDGARTHPVRTKRCACSNPQDLECHYFCHLDIIWVNTPSKTTVYGLGGGLQRRKRFAGRCTCARLDDKTCTSFCYLRCEHQNSPAEALRTRGRRRVCKSPEIQSEKRPQLDILSILRDAVHNSKRALDTRHSGGELLFQAQRKNA